jgi:hypothetical protein
MEANGTLIGHGLDISRSMRTVRCNRRTAIAAEACGFAANCESLRFWGIGLQGKGEIWLRQIDVARQKCVGFVVVLYEELRVRRDRRDCNCAVRL